MTNFELVCLKSILTNYRNSESCADAMAEDDVDEALGWINRELRLKEIEKDPTGKHEEH